MKQFLEQLRAQFMNIWEKFNRTQKVLLIVTTVLVFVGLLYFGNVLTRPSFVPLYSNLNLQDAAAISEKLKEMKIPFQLADSGTTILVRDQDKYSLRLEMAGIGLPKDGIVGFETFNQVKFGETDTNKKIRYLVALQGELTRTIQELTEVDRARVHIVIPQPSLYLDNEKSATASVLLKLKPYVTLKQDQIKGIIHLVASSVEGLKPENVTVVDTYGRVLSDGVLDNQRDSAVPLTATQLEIKTKYENELAKKAQSMLEQVLGYGKAVVRVSAVLDFDKVERYQEDYGKPVTVSTRTIEETGQGQTQAVGAAGTGDNIDSINIPGQDGQNSYSRTDTTKNYEIPKIIESRVVAPGSVKSLSVAVIVDGEIQGQQQSGIQETVARAVGLDLNRGDQITVTGMPFNNESLTKMQQAMDTELRQAYITRMLTVLGSILGGLLLLFFAIRRFKKATAEKTPSAIYSITNESDPLADLDPAEREKAMIRDQIQKLARQQPQEVAKLLKTWLLDDSR